MFESAPIPIVLTTLDDEILDANAAFEELSGYECEEVRGRNAKGLGFWGSPRDQQRLRGALAGGDGFSDLELELRTKGGRVVDVLMSAARVETDGRRGLVKMFVDVTQRKQSERELQRALQDVMQDTSWLARRVMERLAETRGEAGEVRGEVVDLTPRELEVLSLIADAYGNEAIAERLGLAPTMVRNYVTKVYTKIGVSSRVEAAVWARERGLGGL